MPAAIGDPDPAPMKALAELAPAVSELPCSCRSAAAGTLWEARWPVTTTMGCSMSRSSVSMWCADPGADEGVPDTHGDPDPAPMKAPCLLYTSPSPRD
eukprot:9637202-Alexandrium_andersonii.AAC.1